MRQRSGKKEREKEREHLANIVEKNKDREKEG